MKRPPGFLYALNLHFVLSQLVLCLLLCLNVFHVQGQVTTTANDGVPAYSNAFQYGINADYTNDYWTDQRLSKIASNAGSSTIRLALYDFFLEQNGIDVRKDAFNYDVDSVHFTNELVFLNGTAQNHLEGKTYPGCSNPSLLFKNLYTPAFIDSSGVQVINHQNLYAQYVYNVVTNYGRGIKFYEVWNEPDFTNTSNGDAPPGASGNWWDNAPNAADLSNMNAPVYNYVRMLRITYQVVKTLNPNALVATGGVGYPSFLDAILRYTDNPDNGKVTAEYPLQGGAYFDVLSFHSYPFYDLAIFNSTTQKNSYPRHSDGNSNRFIVERNNFENVAFNHGYDGSKFPKKIVICTETNVPSRPDPADNTHWGSPEMQKNYIIKCLVTSQATNIKQLYLYELADGAGNTPIDVNDFMGLYNPLYKVQMGGETLTQEGTAHLTTSSQLAGLSFDQNLTTFLALPAGLGGEAFSGTVKGKLVHKYVLWAKTTIDMSETAAGSYSFPASLQTGKMVRSYSWNAGKDTSAYTKISSQNIALTASPVFLISDSLATLGKSVSANAGPARTIVLPKDTISLSGNGSTASNTTITKYSWKQTIGPSTVVLTTPAQVKTFTSSLIKGNYAFLLTVSDATGIKDSASVSITVSPADTLVKPPDTANTAFFSNLVLFPNPVLTALSARSTFKGNGMVQIQIYDMNGKLIYSGSVIKSSDAFSTLIQFNNLASGIYFFRLTLGSVRQKASFIKY